MESALKPLHHRRDALFPQRFPCPASGFPFYGRHHDAGNPTRHDPLEMREVGRDVEREAVPRDPLLHVDADARDLPAMRPDARESRIAFAGDGKNAQGRDERLLQRAQVPVQVLLVGGEVENGIPDELSRPVKRDVAAAFDLEDLDSDGLDQIPGVRIPAQGNDRGMFEEQQHIVREPTGDPIFSELPLPLQCLRIRHRSGLNDTDLVHAVPVPLPSSPFPLIAQRVATMANAMLSSSQATNPRMPKKRSSNAARKPTRHAPTAASTAITPRCQIFSSARLRYQATAPATPTAATRPATSGLPAVSWYTARSRSPRRIAATIWAAVRQAAPNPTPDAREPSPRASGSLTGSSLKCAGRGPANRAPPRRPPPTSWDGHESRDRFLPRCIRSRAPPPARGSFRTHARRRCARPGFRRISCRAGSSRSLPFPPSRVPGRSRKTGICRPHSRASVPCTDLPSGRCWRLRDDNRSRSVRYRT